MEPAQHANKRTDRRFYLLTLLYQRTNVFEQYVASSSGPQYRFPRYFSFDLRVSKDIRVTRKHAIRLSGSLMNLTNHFNPLEVHSNVADPQYGAFFGNYPRRRFSISTSSISGTSHICDASRGLLAFPRDLRDRTSGLIYLLRTSLSYRD